MMMTPVFLSAALLLILPAASVEVTGGTNFLITVMSPFSNETYETVVPYNGNLQGGLHRLAYYNPAFQYAHSVNPDFDMSIESVNDLFRDAENKWEVLVEDENGTVTKIDGIGCYKPKENDNVILRFIQSP